MKMNHDNKIYNYDQCFTSLWVAICEFAQIQ